MPTDPQPILNAQELLAGQHNVDQRILEQLRNVATTQCRCLECGYNGLMRLTAAKRPWWGSHVAVAVASLFAFLITGAGIIGVVVAAFAGWLVYMTGETYSKQFMDCPNCSRSLARA